MKHNIYGTDSQLFELGSQWLVVIDNMIRSKFSAVLHRYCPRCCGYYLKAKHFFHDLNRNTAYTSCTTNQQHFFRSSCCIQTESGVVYQPLPDCKAGQRKSRCFGKTQTCRFPANHTAVNDTVLSVVTLPRNAPCKKDLVTRLETSVSIGSNRIHHTSSIPAADNRVGLLQITEPSPVRPDLYIHRVYSHRMNFYTKIVTGYLRHWHVKPFNNFLTAITSVTKRFHDKQIFTAPAISLAGTVG